MTNNADIEVGDKIRATSRESRDIVEALVTKVSQDKSREMFFVDTHTLFLDSEYWEFEILEKAPVPLPTGHLAVVGADNLTPYVRMFGAWYNVGRYMESKLVPDDVVRNAIRGSGFRVLYEGIQ